MKKEDEFYMMRCMDLARHGLGTTYPNPLVGSVVVYHGRVIGEGFHRKSGEPHAEALAISSVRDRSLLKDATIYVNLEPCSHYGKTPPCANLIVSSGIPRAVIGTRDTSSKVAGRGVEILKKGGCSVTEGVLEEESRRINRRFFTWHEKKRPYIILKWAESADGFIDRVRKKDDPRAPNWISGPLGRQLVHKWRSEEQAILTGTRTALMDDPALTVREWSGTNPLRMVIDRDLVLPPDLKLFDNTTETVVFNQRENRRDHQTEYVRLDFTKEIIPQILDFLYHREIQSLIVEGGAITLNGFIRSGLWDEARVIQGTEKFLDGVKAPEIPLQPDERFSLPDTTYLVYLNRQGKSFLS